MKKIVVSLLVCMAVFEVSAQTLTGDEVLQRIDDNMALDQAEVVSTMIISGRTGKRTITSRSWIRGDDRAFVEYLSPPREKGKKMLRVEGKLWTYVPEPNDRIITISGHLLRQSVMGSDLSYEDLMENNRLSQVYDAQVLGEEELNRRACLILELTASVENVAYARRKIWVDNQRWIPLKEERFAKSGKLLKTTTIEEVFLVGNRWYPKRTVYKDMLSRGEGTEFIIESIKFDVQIPDHKFTKASLRK